MKRLLSIAIFTIGLSASFANAQEVNADKENAIVSNTVDSQAPNANKSQESLIQKALSVGGSVHARIDHTKQSLLGLLKDKLSTAQNSWKAGKEEWNSANAKHDIQYTNVSVEKEDKPVPTTYY